MESQPQNPELRINPENFHPWNKHVFENLFIATLTNVLLIPDFTFLKTL